MKNKNNAKKTKNDGWEKTPETKYINNKNKQQKNKNEKNNKSAVIIFGIFLCP